MRTRSIIGAAWPWAEASDSEAGVTIPDVAEIDQALGASQSDTEDETAGSGDSSERATLSARCDGTAMIARPSSASAAPHP